MKESQIAMANTIAVILITHHQYIFTICSRLTKVLKKNRKETMTEEMAADIRHVFAATTLCNHIGMSRGGSTTAGLDGGSCPKYIADRPLIQNGRETEAQTRHYDRFIVNGKTPLPLHLNCDSRNGGGNRDSRASNTKLVFLTMIISWMN